MEVGAFSTADAKAQVEAALGGVVTRVRSVGWRRGSWENSAQSRDHITRQEELVMVTSGAVFRTA